MQQWKIRTIETTVASWTGPYQTTEDVVLFSPDGGQMWHEIEGLDRVTISTNDKKPPLRLRITPSVLLMERVESPASDSANGAASKPSAVDTA